MNFNITKKVIKKFIRLFRKKSFALNELDLKLLAHLEFKSGFFVEVGANDGISQSNTLLLEQKLDWRGILIEAIPSLAKQCMFNRPKCIVENCALVSSNYEASYVEMRYCNLMSVVKGGMKNPEDEEYHIQRGKRFLGVNENVHTVKARAMTLTQVLEKHCIDEVDFLSLDVEGYETEVLKGIDLRRHAPKWMLIEVRNRDEIESIIATQYRPVSTLHSCESYADILYERLT